MNFNKSVGQQIKVIAFRLQIVEHLECVRHNARLVRRHFKVTLAKLLSNSLVGDAKMFKRIVEAFPAQQLFGNFPQTIFNPENIVVMVV